MLVTISITVIAASVVVFTLFLVPVLLQVRRTARELEKLVDTTRLQIVPLSHDLTAISSGVNGILKSIHRQMDKVEEGLVPSVMLPVIFRHSRWRFSELLRSHSLNLQRW
jgi:uncharacterized protein YoxC